MKIEEIANAEVTREYQASTLKLTFHLFRMQGEADCKGSSVGGRCEED